jgi:hypothetical protein
MAIFCPFRCQARAEPAELPRNGRTQELDRYLIITLSGTPSSAAAPRLWPQQQAVPLQAGLISHQLFSLRASFVMYHAAVVEKSKIYDARRQLFADWESRIQIKLNYASGKSRRILLDGEFSSISGLTRRSAVAPIRRSEGRKESELHHKAANSYGRTRR